VCVVCKCVRMCDVCDGEVIVSYNKEGIIMSQVSGVS